MSRHRHTHTHSDTVHTDSSQESATTTSTTLLLVNLEASFTGVTWLRRCHSPTNQYHSESSGPTVRVCGCVCACVWVAESCSSCVWTLPFWPVYRTVITWEETSVQLLLTSSTNEVKHRQIGKEKGSRDDRSDRDRHMATWMDGYRNRCYCCTCAMDALFPFICLHRFGCRRVCVCIHVRLAHTYMRLVWPSPVAGWAWLVDEPAWQRVSNPRREFPWQTYWFYGFPPKVAIMIHHGRIWQDRLLGEEVAKQFAAVKSEGGLWLLIPQRNKKRRRNILPHPSVHPSIPLSLGVLFPGVSIWMYEFVTDGSGTMDWLCCFVKDKGCAGIMDSAVFSVWAARTELRDKPIVRRCAVFLVQAQSILSSRLNPEVFRNIKTIFHFLAERYFK